jgi:hypothetical protein
MGRAVHAAARHAGRYVEVPRAGHNDLAQVAGAAYWEFLRDALAAASGDA